MTDENNHLRPLGFAEEQAVFKGQTQNVRALSEGWVAAHMFCPACGAERLRALPNNSPVADFVCDACAEEFELKAKKGALSRSISDGAYGAMNAVEAIGRPEFTLDDVYAHEANLSVLYPGNNNVRPKIRQQLQVLRDRGWLAFSERGAYRRA